MDEKLAVAMRELVQRALAAGITNEEIQGLYAGQPEQLEEEIQRRVNEVAGLGWEGEIVKFKIRRKRIVAAYLGGVSLRQLAHLESVSTQSIHSMVLKELPTEVRLRLAAERTARGRRRQPTWTPTQVSAMLQAVAPRDLRDLPIAVLAARMVKAATTEANEDDESDPYLRDEAESETTRHLSGSDGRGDGSGSEEVRTEREGEADRI